MDNTSKFTVCILFLFLFYWSLINTESLKEINRKIEKIETVKKEFVDSLVTENHVNMLSKYSFETMRREVDSLKMVVWAGNRAWLTIYDFLAPEPSNKWDGFTTKQVDSIISSPEYEIMTQKECFDKLKKEGVISNELEY